MSTTPETKPPAEPTSAGGLRWDEPLDDEEIAPVRHAPRWVAALLIIVLVGLGIRILVTNPHFQWDVVRQYLFSSAILQGLLKTIELTVVAMAIGIVLGIILAVMRMSPNPIISGFSRTY